MVITSPEQFTTYFLTLILSFLGLYVGALLAFISPEELNGGYDYFRALQSALIVLIAVFILRSFGANVLILFALSATLAVTLYLLRNTPVAQFAYYCFGIALFLTVHDHDLFLLVASLVFLFGVPAGTLYAARHIGQERSVIFSDLLLNFGLFFVVALVANLFTIFFAAL